MRHLGKLVVAAAVVAVEMVGMGSPTSAWKPYTHNWSAEVALDDAQDGVMTINGRSYALDARVAQALVAKPAQYRAGVVGPDGFPDLIMGQAIIHPENTGAWLTHVLDTAWRAQEAGSPYTDDQQLEILAFAYGFLTHAAGDAWAHTFVNDYAQGVFPAISDVLTDPESAAIALRHIIVEGYVGDATPGFDGNPDRTFVEGTYSDDSTPGTGYAPPPDAWLWETFIGRAKNAAGLYLDPLPGQPTAERGPMIDFFFDLHNELRTFAGDDPYSTEFLVACAFVIPLCPLGVVIPYEAARTYADAWAKDIEDGLQHWSAIGMAFTAGMFDPATRRAAQDDICGENGSDATSSARAACEAGVSVLDTLIWYLDEGNYFTTEGPRLASMLGAPDAFLEVLGVVEAVLDFIDDLIDFPNPLADFIADAKEALKSLLYDALAEVLGFDVQLFLDALSNPGTFLSNSYSEPLPPPLDVFNGTGLFAPDALAEINALMGINPVLGPDGRLPDDAELVLSGFAPLNNTTTLAKLVLLTGPQLDAVLTDELGRPISTYASAAAPADPLGRRQNIMTTGLDGSPWLRSIDSDHSWRRDGLPRFCTTGLDGSCSTVPTALARDAALDGGTGQMPIWESCALRPSFAQLFDDWENGGEQFPALGDLASPDPVNDPAAPVSSLAQVNGVSYDDGVRTFVAADNVFRVDAVDVGPLAFPSTEVELRYRVNGGAWLDVVPGSQFSLVGPDGLYVVEFQAGDPCHTLDTADDGAGLVAGPIQSMELWLDATPPVLTCPIPPFATTYDTDDLVTIDYELDDGPDGSGVGSEAATIDGFEALPGVVPIGDGDVIDTYDFYVGVRTVEVTAADNLGNAASASCTLEIRATTESLLTSVKRGLADGDINAVLGNSLQSKLRNALRKHDEGRHGVEANMVAAFGREVAAQRNKKIDAVLADRLLAAVADLVARRP